MSSTRDRLRKKLRSQGSKIQAPATSKGTTKKDCVKCKKATTRVHAVLEVNICQACEKEDPDYHMITELQIKKTWPALEITKSDRKELQSVKVKSFGSKTTKFLLHEIESLAEDRGIDRGELPEEPSDQEEKQQAKKSKTTTKPKKPKPVKKVPPKEVNFSSEKSDYGPLSNISPHPVTIENQTFPTAEHYLLSKKCSGTAFAKHLSSANDSKSLKTLLETRTPTKFAPDWDKIKDNVLFQVLLAKFQQNKDLKNILLDTGSAKITYKRVDDSWLGIGSDGMGDNMLGKTLEVVRGKLTREKESREKNNEPNGDKRGRKTEQKEVKKSRKRKREEESSEESSDEESSEESSEEEDRRKRRRKEEREKSEQKEKSEAKEKKVVKQRVIPLAPCSDLFE